MDSLTHTVSTVQAGGAVTLIAGQDLTSQAAQLSGSTVNLGAGHDVNLQAVTDTTTRSTDHFQNHTDVSTGQTDQTVRGTTISGSHDVSIAANHDLTVSAGTLSSTNGNVALAAGNNLTLNAADETHSSYRDTSTHHSGLFSSDSTKTHDATSDTYAIGTAIHGNNVVLAAGNNLTTQAAQLTANNALSLSAVNNVTLGAGQDTHTEEHDYQHSSFNFFSDSSKRFGSVDPEWRSNQSSTTINQTTSIGSTLSGDTVTVAAGHDLTGTAVQIAGTHDVTLAAGNNLTLNAGQDTYTETQSSGTSHTGLMNGGGFSVLIGNKSQKTTTTDKEVSYTGSLVGSTNGAVTLTAGNNVHITGSDVLSQTATTIVGKNVTIDAAVGSQDVTQTQTIHQGGIHVGLSGGAISAAQNVYGAAQGISQSHDSRLQALYAMQAAQTLFSPGAANGMGLAQGQTGASAIAGAISDPHLAASGSNGNGGQSGDSSGVNLQIGLTGSTASQKQHTHDDITYGSKISSNGDVTIAATGGDLNVIGSTINGNNVALSAAHDINLLSQAEQHTQTQTSSNASAGVGVSLGTNGFNVYVQASMGKANAHGNGETHTDTSVTASNTLSLLSGNDTTIQGAQATGKTVLADIGHNLTIASEQDTNDYASKQWQAGGTVMFGMGGGGSFSYNQSTMKNNYASVTQMSGIGAGSGGFDIQVGGNTDLKGAVIASSAGADKNILDTTSLTYSNIQNQSRYSASSFGVGGGGSASSFSAMPTGLSVPQSSSSNSTTDAAISPGTIIVRNDPNQDLSGLSRTASLSNANGLSNNFDPQKIAENQQLGILAGQVGMTAAGDIEQAAHLKNGSAGAVALHTVVGGAMAALGGGNVLQGAAGAGVSEASIPYLQQSGALGVLAGTTLIGAAVGGGSGAATALAGTQYNYLTHPQLAALQDQINQKCGGDANSACAQPLKENAQFLSAIQEAGLVSDCSGGTPDACQSDLGTAKNYLADPLASQLGLQSDQGITVGNLEYINGFHATPQTWTNEFYKSIQSDANDGNPIAILGQGLLYQAGNTAAGVESRVSSDGVGNNVFTTAQLRGAQGTDAIVTGAGQLALTVLTDGTSAGTTSLETKGAGAAQSSVDSGLLTEMPDPYEGVRQASAYLKSMGVERAQRVQILQSFDVSTLSVETAGENLFGLRFHDFGETANPMGSYLFETFTPQINRYGLALPYEWNGMTGISQWQVVPGTTYLRGLAAPQFGFGAQYTGGAEQMYILQPWKYGTLK